MTKQPDPTTATLLSYGADAAKVLHFVPELRLMNDWVLENTLRTFSAQAIDIPRMAEAHPKGFKVKTGALFALFKELQQHGVEAPAVVINTYQPVIGLSWDHVRSTMTALRAEGLDAPQIVEQYPPALFSTDAQVHIKAEIFRQADIWDEVLEDLNSGRRLELLTVPNESLLFSLANRPGRFKADPLGAVLDRNHGERGLRFEIQSVQAGLGVQGKGNPDFIADLGAAGEMYVANEKALRARPDFSDNKPSLDPRTAFLHTFDFSERLNPTVMTPSESSFSL